MRICQNCADCFDAATWTCPACGWLPPQRGGIPQFAPEFEHENAGFKAEYFAELARRENGHFWFEARNRLLQWAIARYAPHAESYLEVGCGTGFVLSGVASRFPHMRLSASEIFSAGLAVAQSRVPGAQFLQLDARRLPFRDEFDLVGAFDVLEHIEEDEVVLRSAYGALRKNGILMLTVPQHRWLWSQADTYAHHKRRYVRADMVAKLQAAGFRCLRMTSFVSFLLPVLWLARMGQRNCRPEDFDPSQEFDVHPWVNGALRAVLAAERGLIRTGVSLPAGGSLLAVACKD